MPSIGSNNFVTLHGQIEPLGLQVESITRPGVDGHAFRRIGKRAEPSVLTGLLDVVDAAAVTAALAAYRATQGTIVTVVDGRGVTTNNVVVVMVKVIETRPVGVTSGGLNATPAFIIRSEWTLQPTEIP